MNVDECGCIDTPKPKQVLCPAKVKPNHQCSSKKGEISTAVVFVNAPGYHLKPLVIHKEACIQATWKEGITEGTTLGVSENGWIDKQLFTTVPKSLLSTWKVLAKWGHTKSMFYSWIYTIVIVSIFIS